MNRIDNESKATTGLSDAAKRARAAYQQAYRRKHPDRVRATVARYWERKAQEQTNAEGGDQDNA